MTDREDGCYGPEELASFLAGKLTATRVPRLERHLLDCESCRKAIESLWLNDRLKAGLEERKATLALASRIGAEEAIPAVPMGAPDSRGEETLRRARRLLDRLVTQPTTPVEGERPPRATKGGGLEATLDVTSPAVGEPSFTSPVPPRIPGLRLGGTIGRGGMGVVYAAWDEVTNRPLACKVLSSAFPSFEERERFELEARAAERLDHPNIIRVEASGTVDDRPYLVMELAAGGNLQRLLDGMLQPPTAAAAAVATLAEALAHAHARGVLHRDLKPSNILLVPRSPPDARPPDARPPRGGRLEEFDPKIADFGIAKLLDSGTLRTVTGQMLGTPAFAAPEQFLSELGAVGPASDVYSLGAILYLMLTGLPPLPEDNPRRLLSLVRDFEPVPPRQLRPELPEALETICLCCLEKRPRWRYRSAAEMAGDLRRFLAGEPIAARPRSRWRRGARWVAQNRVVTATVLALIVLTVGSLAYASLQWRLKTLLEIYKVQELALSQANLEKFSSDIRAKQLLTYEALDASRDVEALAPCLQVALAPRVGDASSVSDDAPEIVIAALRANSILETLPKIRLRMIVPSIDKAPPAAPTRNVRYNPVTGHVAVTDASQSRVWEIDVATGRTTEHSLEAGPFSPDLAWRLAVAQEAPGLSLVRPHDDAAPALPLESPATPPDAWRRLWISPRQHIAVALGTRQGNLAGYAWRLPSGRALRGVAEPLVDTVREAVFFRQGVALFGDGVQHVIVWDGEAIIGVKQRPDRSGPVYIEPWDWTIDPRTWPLDLPASSPDARIWAALKKLNTFTKCTAATVSPSHTRIALGYGNGRVGIIDDIDCDLRFDKLEQLRHPVEKVAFSPDSQRLLAYSEAGELLVVDLEEARLAIPVLPHFHRIIDASWSPDSREVAVLDERNLLTVWRLPNAETQPAQETAANSVTESVTESESAKHLVSEPGNSSSVAAGTIQLDRASTAQRSSAPPPHYWSWSRGAEPVVVLRDRWVEIWEPQTRRKTASWLLPERAVLSSVPDRQGRVLLWMQAGGDGLSERALLDGSTGVFTPTSYRASLGSLGDSKPTEQGYAVSVVHASHIEHWWLNGRPWPEEIRLAAELGPLFKVQISPTGRELAIMTRGGYLVVWDLVGGFERFRASIVPPNTDMNATFSLDGQQLYVTSPQGMRGWEMESGTEMKGFEAFRGRHVISLGFHPTAPLVVTMCDNRTVTVHDLKTWMPLHSFSPNSTLTYAVFGREGGTVLIGMWNLPDADNDRLYLRELWSPAVSRHGHAEMWDYRTASRINSAFAFRGFGDRENMLFSPTRVFGVDMHYRPRFGQWPTRDTYGRDQLIAIGTQFLQRDLSASDAAGLQSARRLSATELVEAWQRSSGRLAANLESP
jgi:serine/threonine protein kinase/WD40 repeat protein